MNLFDGFLNHSDGTLDHYKGTVDDYDWKVNTVAGKWVTEIRIGLV